MSYGENAVMSAFTLAVMEDIGHYIGVYNKSQCMGWGRNQGCDFVKYRCGKRKDDLSLRFGKLEQCKRKYVYTSEWPPLWEGGQSLVIGGSSLVILEGKACNPL